jgi:hypothetical protein
VIAGAWFGPIHLPGLTLTAQCGYGYGYGTSPAVDAISPTMGSTAGATTVTLTGCGFTGATSVHFGATASTNFTFNSDTKITATSPAHAAGVVNVSVTTPLGTSSSQPGNQFSYLAPGTACTSVTITAAPSPPQASGTPVTATAVASGCPTPLYQFVLRPQSSSTWQTVQTYSSSNTYHWDSTGAQTGIVFLGVNVHDAGNSNAYDAVMSTPYQVNVVPCASPAIMPAPASPQLSGTPIVWTGSAANCPKPLFRFVMRPASQSVWQTVQDYSSNNKYNWNSTGAAAGIVFFGINVKDASSTAPYDAVVSSAFTVTVPSCTSVGIVPVPNTVVHSTSNGTHVIATATAVGCTDPNPLFEFWIRPASSSTWQMVQAYSTNNTYNWNTTGAAVGTVFVGVHVKDASSPNAFDAVQSAPVTVT